MKTSAFPRHTEKCGLVEFFFGVGSNPVLGIVRQGRKLPLRDNEKDIVCRAIVNEAKRISFTIEALAVWSNHIHLVTQYFPEPIGQTVSRLKNVASSVLRKHGRAGRVWTRGFD